jgi:hypothetical protein
MNNGKGSNKDSLRLSSQNHSSRRKFRSNKDNLRFNNQDNNLRREFGNRKDKNKELRFSNHNTLSLKENLEVGSVEVEKAGRIEVRGDITIRSNDIWQSLLHVEHLDGERRGTAILPFLLSSMRFYFLFNNKNDRFFKSPSLSSFAICHPESIRFAQHKFHEGSS